MSVARIRRLLDDSAGIGGGLPVPAALSSHWRGNEPASLTQITDELYDSIPIGGFTFDAGNYTDGTIITDASAPFDSNSVLHVDYEGAASGIAIWRQYRTIPSTYNQIYVCWAQKLPDSFFGNGSGTNKIGVLNIAGQPKIIFNIQCDGTDPAKVSYVLQNGAEASVANASGSVARICAGDHNDGIGDWDRGEWVIHEYEIVANTGSNYDGVLRIWKNGSIVVDRDDIFFDASVHDFGGEEFHDYHNWGGTTGTAPEGTGFYRNRIFISGGTV